MFSNLKLTILSILYINLAIAKAINICPDCTLFDSKTNKCEDTNFKLCKEKSLYGICFSGLCYTYKKDCDNNIPTLTPVPTTKTPCPSTPEPTKTPEPTTPCPTTVKPTTKKPCSTTKKSTPKVQKSHRNCYKNYD